MFKTQQNQPRTNERKMPKDRHLQKLNRERKDGIIVVSSRLKKTQIGDEVKHQVVLRYIGKE